MIRGGCMCGAVQLEIELPPKWCAHCHCGMCRHAHSSAFVTWVGVERDKFRLTAGEDSLVRYASSAAAQRSFCRTCGTTLLFEGDRWPNEVHIARACFGDDVDLVPTAHAYFDDRAPWLNLGEDLARYGGKSGTEPLE